MIKEKNLALEINGPMHYLLDLSEQKHPDLVLQSALPDSVDLTQQNELPYFKPQESPDFFTSNRRKKDLFKDQVFSEFGGIKTQAIPYWLIDASRQRDLTKFIDNIIQSS